MTSSLPLFFEASEVEGGALLPLKLFEAEALHLEDYINISKKHKKKADNLVIRLSPLTLTNTYLSNKGGEIPMIHYLRQYFICEARLVFDDEGPPRVRPCQSIFELRLL